MVLADNFRRSDHSGWAKAGWTLFVIFVPLIGVLGLHDRAAEGGPGGRVARHGLDHLRHNSEPALRGRLGLHPHRAMVGVPGQGR